LLTMSIPMAMPVSAATLGPNNAGTGSNNFDIGEQAWTSPGNITTIGSPYATATVAGGGTTATNYLQGTNYGFAIPNGATINGITVVINRQSSGSLSPFMRDSRISLVKGGAVQTTNKAATGTDWPTSGLLTAIYGSPSDLWGTSWTPADINANNFGVVLSAVNANTVSSRSRDATVDYIRITVTYSLSHTITASAGTGGTISPSGAVSVNDGASQTFTIVPSSGNIVSAVSIDGGASSGRLN
jgi:hypothetical protein